MRIAKAKSLVMIAVLILAGVCIGCASTGKAVAKSLPNIKEFTVRDLCRSMRSSTAIVMLSNLVLHRA